MQVGVEIAKALENRRVFIIDEDEIIRTALQFMLHDEYEAHEVDGTGAVFQKAKAQPPDLVILAERIVRTEGAALLQRMRREIPGVKILVVVEPSNLAYGKECVSIGAHGFLAKPLKIEFVRQKADSLLGRGKGGVTMPLKVL